MFLLGNDRYNVIVVGAGLAGTATALICAKNNLSVALIERGEYPGSKNMFGGAIYRKAFTELIPAFWEEAPLERAITREELWLMDNDSSVNFSFENTTYASPPYNKFTVIRSKFDKWFANQAVKEGVHLKTSTTVSDVIFEKEGLLNKKASGVILEDGTKIYCDIVVIAEGLIGNLVHKTGLKKEKTADTLALYVKEILELPQKTIESRFNIEKNEGVNIGIAGTPTSGAIGKAGIWINKSTISLIIGTYLDQLISKNLNPYQLLVNLKKHPLIKKRIKGASTLEYLSHLIPKGGPAEMPEIYDDGLLVVGDALAMVGGKGTAFAVLSGKLAAETIIMACAKNDFNKNILSSYKKKLFNLFITKENLEQKNQTQYFKDFSDADLLISKTINKIANEYFNFTLETNKQKMKKLFKELETIQPLTKSIHDLIAGLQNWRII